MPDAPDNPARYDRLPWPIAGAAVVAFAALYLTGKRFVGMPVMAVLLAATYAVPARLPRSRVISWALRGAAFVGIIAAVGVPQETVTAWFVKPEYTNLIGYLLAAELVVRAWSPRDAAHARESYGVILVLGGLVMTAASDTYERTHVPMLAPLYFLLVILSVRAFSRLGTPGAPPPPRRTLRPGPVVLRALAFFLALGTAFSGIYAVNRYERQVTSWAVQLLRERKEPANEIGLSSAPQLQSIFNPEPSMTRVLLIRGPQGERYLRALAFDTYRSTRWLPDLSERPFQLVPQQQLRTSAAAAGERFGFTRLEDTLGLLPVPLQASSLACEAPLEREALGAVRESEAAVVDQYDAVVPTAPAYQGPLCVPPTAEQRARLLTVPTEVDPRVAELARRVAGTGEPISRVFRLINHLRGSHSYSMEFRPTGEPLSDFILNGRAAHCQYFASALVVMARAAGVPARFVTGYYAHEAYGSDQTVVRERDAHAWAECWVDGLGWMTADATPAGGRPAGLFPQPSRWRDAWERIEDLPRTIREWFSRLDRRRVLRVLGIAAVVGVVAWLARLVRWRRTRRANAEGYAPASEELADAARRFERWMGRQGVAVTPQRTWRDQLAAPPPAPAARPIDVAACFRFIEAYDEARFGGYNGSTIARVRELLEELERR